MQRFVLLGNPNVGKSVLFGLLTGRYAVVSNYPGTTVEVARGHSRALGGELTDAPGCNSLLVSSEDERVARDILIREGPTVLLVADSKNPRRALHLALQVAELGLPLVLVLNMADEAEALGIRPDVAALSSLLGCPVVRTVAVEREGIDALVHAARGAKAPAWGARYPDSLEEEAQALAALLPELPVSRRGVALLLLAGDDTVLETLGGAGVPPEVLRRVRERLEAARRRLPTERLIEEARHAALTEAMGSCVGCGRPAVGAARKRLGLALLRPGWGLLALALTVVVLYRVVGRFGAGTCVDFLESGIFGSPDAPVVGEITGEQGLDLWYRIPFTSEPRLLAHTRFAGLMWYLGRAARGLGLGPGAAGWRGLVWDGLLGEFGLLSMGLTYAFAIVFPIVAFFFLCFGLLEDSGYLPRLAALSDRLMRRIGLNGKAVLPLVLGLGCCAMATLATRILDSRRERIIATMLLALGIPCSAQLGVIAAVLSAVSPWAVVFVLGLVAAHLFFVGWAMDRLLPGGVSDFLLELPPMRVPSPRNIAHKTLVRLRWFLREAVPIFLAGTALLFIADRTGALAALERALAPVVRGVLGLPERTAWAFLMGFLRRDYGAAGLYSMVRAGELTTRQILVSMLVITLFVPCVAQFLVMIKERGLVVAVAMAGFILTYAVAAGALARAMLAGAAALGVGF